jgi:hypothetical protein
LWGGDAEKIARRIRGLYPWPGCRARLVRDGLEAGRVTLVRARALESSGRDGLIGADGTVGAGIGSVEIIEVQPEGKKVMSLNAYQNGHPWDTGMRVESLWRLGGIMRWRLWIKNGCLGGRRTNWPVLWETGLGLRQAGIWGCPCKSW